LKHVISINNCLIKNIYHNFWWNDITKEYVFLHNLILYYSVISKNISCKCVCTLKNKIKLSLLNIIIKKLIEK